jgi:hypothetical protein
MVKLCDKKKCKTKKRNCETKGCMKERKKKPGKDR